MTQRQQALGIDISNWARTGGVNFDKVQQHITTGTYDFLIIKAGLGLGKSAIFDEQRKGAETRNIPYSTYFFPDANKDLKKQAQHYVDMVGTDQPSYFVDVEMPYPEKDGGRLLTANELRKFLNELEKLTKRQPIIYSSIHILSQVRFLTAAKEYKLWIANYPWDKSLLPVKRWQYTLFTDFLDDFANQRPPTLRGTNLASNVILWQFSDRGKGQHYIFNKNTADPRFPGGKKSADLNVSMQDRDSFMKEVFGGSSEIKLPKVTDVTKTKDDEKATYPGMTNQNMIDLFFKATSVDIYWDLIKDAQLDYMAIPRENRDKIYTGPKIEDLPGLTDKEKKALLAVM